MDTTLRRKTREQREAYRRAHLGEFIAVPLGGGYGFARYRGDGDFSFYDLYASDIRPIEEIKRHPILFTLCCNSAGLAKGIWTVIGQEPLEPSLAESPCYFRNPSGSEYVDIYCDGNFRPYAGEDLSKLEPLVVWDTPAHVEDRLRLHFAGEPYPWSERQKVPRELADRMYREYWAKQRGDGKA